ncbi:MAG: ABC transporter ATP-binding protein [Kofleriaceae bacterium]
MLAFLSAFEIVLRVLSPWAFAIVVDHALGGAVFQGTIARGMTAVGLGTDRTTLLITFVLLGLAMQLSHQLVMMFHGRLSVAIGQRMIRDLRDQLYAHVQALTLQHHTATPTGDVVQRLEADTRCVEQLVLRGVFPLTFSVLTLVAMFGVLLTIDLPLALLALAIVPPLYVWLRFYARRMAPRADHARHTDSRFSSRLFENITSIRLIKSNAREDHEQARVSQIAGDAARAWINVGCQNSVFTIVNGVLTVAGSSLIVLVGGISVLEGRLTVGTLLLVLAYVGFVYGPLSAIAGTTGSLQQALASARRVRAAFAATPEATSPHPVSADRIRGEIRFDDVAFSYGDKPVLDGVHLTARPGEVIALVGPSGAGKSTLASMLVRFFDAKRGVITIDDLPIDQYELSSLRQQTSIVLQDAVLMSGTVRDNLRYGRLDATDEEIERAARAAHAHDFIVALPNGYDTELGEAGAGLSGGQRQRLSIARAFLKDAPILILDEPTSSLDTISENRIVDAIHRLWVGRTTFVIAHRLSTVRDADRILVMDRGRIVAEGTHDELCQTSALYRKLAAQLTDGETHDHQIDGLPVPSVIDAAGVQTGIEIPARPRRVERPERAERAEGGDRADLADHQSVGELPSAGRTAGELPTAGRTAGDLSDRPC